MRSQSPVPQHPYVSTASGTHFHPNSLHLSSLALLLSHCLASKAVDPAVTLTSVKVHVLGLSDEGTIMSKAAGLTSSQGPGHQQVEYIIGHAKDHSLSLRGYIL